MSQGSSLPYHLRTNKAIDRRIFFEALIALYLDKNIREYNYVSLGGPMLEDHKILHQEYGFNNLFSLEKDKDTLARQEFNKPFSCIECKQESAHDFVVRFNPKKDESSIIWFDFTDTDWNSQFNDCETLLENLKEFDIFKVTFNANPDALRASACSENIVDSFKSKSYQKVLSENLNENDLSTMDKLAKTLSSMFHNLCQASLNDAGLEFVPIVQFRYIDNRHHMYTIAGIIMNSGERPEFKNSSQDNLNSLLSCDWNTIHEINVPDLTVKERIEINQHLPLNYAPNGLVSSVKIKTKQIDQYRKYYRFIPHFQRTAI
jgi:hypothetical protein